MSLCFPSLISMNKRWTRQLYTFGHITYVICCPLFRPRSQLLIHFIHNVFSQSSSRLLSPLAPFYSFLCGCLLLKWLWMFTDVTLWSFAFTVALSIIYLLCFCSPQLCGFCCKCQSIFYLNWNNLQWPVWQLKECFKCPSKVLQAGAHFSIQATIIIEWGLSSSSMVNNFILTPYALKTVRYISVI